jgi:hypothetical protein
LDLIENMDFNRPHHTQSPLIIISHIHTYLSKPSFQRKILSIFVIFSLFVIGQSCSRSPYQGSAAYDCEGGDRVILNERLFCVFNELRYTREINSNNMVDQDNEGIDLDTGIEQTVIEMDDMGIGESQVMSQQKYCPPTVPIAFRYETLTLCSAGEISNELLEAVVAEWTTLYNQSEDSASDMNSDAVFIDYGIVNDELNPDGEVSNQTNDMAMTTDE